MLDEIKKLPKEFIKNLDVDVNHLKVYLVQDFDLKLLRRIVQFGIDTFGDMAADEFVIVPQIRHGNVFILKEEEKNKLLGLAILIRDWEDSESVYLFDFAISQEYRGMGMGYEFLKIIAENLLEQGFARISLTVDVENDPAIKLYRDKIGFDAVLLRKNEYGQGQHRFIMELDIVEFLSE